LKWEERREAIKRVVLSELPDLLCLQEVQSAPGDPLNDHAEWFKQWLRKRGYEVAYGRKMGAVKGQRGGPQSLLKAEWEAVAIDGVQIGNLTAWKTSAFTCEHSHTVPLALLVASACSDDITAEHLSARHGQVMVVSHLRHLSTGHQIVIGNIHLTAPRSPEDYDRKLVQTQQLAAGFEALANEGQAQEGERQPRMMLLGDFNATPDSELYELLSAGKISSARMTKLTQRGLKGLHGRVKKLPFASPSTAGLELQSAHTTRGGLEPKFTNYTEGFKGCLDYITYCPDGLECTAVGDFPAENVLKNEVALPNSLQPSDHLPVMCRIEFK